MKGMTIKVNQIHLPSAGVNPLLWELGHVAFFYQYHVCRNLNRYKKTDLEIPKVLDDAKYTFDSFLISREYRFKIKTFNLKQIKQYYIDNIEYCTNWLKNNDSDTISTYLILLGMLHNEMHNESFLFSRQVLNLAPPIITKYNFKPTNNKINLEFVKIDGGEFRQGREYDEYMVFDNEVPSFKQKVESFYISQTCVTNLMYKKFVDQGGYKNKDLWTPDGWRWIQKLGIEKPIYWFKRENTWFRKYFDQEYPLEDNYPIVNVSWYEAKAFCKWIGGRLPTESEWEYVATNNGTTKNPSNQIVGNIGYKTGDVVPVDFHPEGDTKHKHNNGRGVIQLLGNVWEWCEDSFYPYDGFEIDPVYREFSYPFFGFKRYLEGDLGQYQI